LTAIQSPVARADAYRHVTRTLVARQHPSFVRLLATAVSGPGQAEVLGVVGLEFLRIGRTQEAVEVADLAIQTIAPVAAPPVAPAEAAKDEDAPPPKPDKVDKEPAPAKVETPAVQAPSLIALCILLNKPPDVLEKLKPQGEVAWRLGQAEALARNNDFTKA